MASPPILSWSWMNIYEVIIRNLTRREFILDILSLIVISPKHWILSRYVTSKANADSVLRDGGSKRAIQLPEQKLH